MLTFCGPQRLPTTCTSEARTRSSCGTAKSWPSHSPARLHQRLKNTFIPVTKFNEEAKIMTMQMLKVKEKLRGTIKGSVLVPADPGYEEARQIWNAMINRRPAVIVQCVQAEDVPLVIRFA